MVTGVFATILHNAFHGVLQVAVLVRECAARILGQHPAVWRHYADIDGLSPGSAVMFLASRNETTNCELRLRRFCSPGRSRYSYSRCIEPGGEGDLLTQLLLLLCYLTGVLLVCWYCRVICSFLTQFGIETVQ